LISHRTRLRTNDRKAYRPQAARLRHPAALPRQGHRLRRHAQDTTRLARTLGLSETQVVHVALANLARQTLPRYEPDDGPLTPEQLAAIDKLVPQERFKPTKRLF